MSVICRLPRAIERGYLLTMICRKRSRYALNLTLQSCVVAECSSSAMRSLLRGWLSAADRPVRADCGSAGPLGPC